MTTFYHREGDTSPALQRTLKDEDGNAVNLTGYNEVRFVLVTDSDEQVEIDDKTAGGVNVTDAAAGEVEYDWDAGSNVSGPGDYRAIFIVTYSDGTEETFPKAEDIEVPVKDRYV